MKLGKGLWKYLSGGSTNHPADQRRRIRSDTTHHHTADNDTDDTNIKDAEDELQSTLAIHELLMVSTALPLQKEEVCQTHEINVLKERLDCQDVKLLLINERIAKLEESNNNNGIHSEEDAAGLQVGGIHNEAVLLEHSLKEEELVDSIVSNEEEEVWMKAVSSGRSSLVLEIEEKMEDKTSGSNTYAALADDAYEDMQEEEELFKDEKLMGGCCKAVDTKEDLIIGSSSEEVGKEAEIVDTTFQQISTTQTQTSVAINKNKNNKNKKKTWKNGKHGRRRPRCPNKTQQATVVSTSTSRKSATSKPSSSPNQYQYFGLIVGLIGKLLHSGVSVLLMRGGKRMYMIGTFITAYWLQGEINNNGFTNIFPNSISSNSNSRGGFNIFQGVRALQDCPEYYIANNYDSYDVGMKVTHKDNVYECTEAPCMWKIIGTCTDNVFWPLTSTLSSRNMQAVSLDDSSIQTESNPTETDLDGLSESEADPTNFPTQLLNRVRTHSPISPKTPLVSERNALL